MDYFGDIPYTEALQGEKFSDPKLDGSQTIYADLLKQLDEAATSFNKAGSVNLGAVDLYYGGDKSKWIKLINSLKIKIYVQQRKAESKASEIQAIVTSGDYISSKGDDFQFKYSSNASAPDSRHPMFSNNYITGASQYMSNYFMNMLLNGKKERDPRLRYYFARQQNINTTKTDEKDCLESVRPNHYKTNDPFCELVEGYWGRDHGDAAGIPPDGRARTTYGIYPAGGRFDANEGNAVLPSSGASGAGVTPILLSNYMDFLLAEAALTMNTGGDASALLKSAMEKSVW